VIAGVVIGGTSLFGGSGGLVGTLIGTIIPVVLLTATSAAFHRHR
jgi:ribose transport system permease protein